MTVSTQGQDAYRVPNDLAQEYLRHSCGLLIKGTTAEKYDYILTEFVRWLNDQGLSIRTAEYADVVKFIEDCVRRKNRESTLQSKLVVIRECYEFIHIQARKRDEISLDPLDLNRIDVSDYLTPDPIEREALTREDIRLLFDAFNSYRNRLMCIVGIETGLRNSDIRDLRLDDISDDQVHVRNPKGGRPYDVPISDELSFELEQWFEHHRDGYVCCGDSGFVFPSKTGDKLETNGSLNQIVKDAAKRAGIQGVIGRTKLSEEERNRMGTDKTHREWYKVTVHSLRHSYITMLDESGVDLTYRMLVANHRNPATTLGYSSRGSDVVSHIRDQFDPPR